MKLNQVILDILNWIRIDLWKGTEENKPLKYKSLASTECFGGMLHKVQRDTPRAIGTYVYVPFTPNRYMSKSDCSYDYHICLDHLWMLDSMQNERLKGPAYVYKKGEKEYIPVEKLKGHSKRNSKHSHIITVIKSSRWLNHDGDYVGEVIFQEKYDFIGPYIHFGRDRTALPIFTRLAMRLRTISPVGMKWDDEITKIRDSFIQ